MRKFYAEIKQIESDIRNKHIEAQHRLYGLIIEFITKDAEKIIKKNVEQGKTSACIFSCVRSEYFLIGGNDVSVAIGCDNNDHKLTLESLSHDGGFLIYLIKRLDPFSVKIENGTDVMVRW